VTILTEAEAGVSGQDGYMRHRSTVAIRQRSNLTAVCTAQLKNNIQITSRSLTSGNRYRSRVVNLTLHRCRSRIAFPKPGEERSRLRLATRQQDLDESGSKLGNSSAGSFRCCVAVGYQIARMTADRETAAPKMQCM
jgi:hypothetical protein